jgi:DNA gyrase/topoisomerase IV subunit B
MNACIPLLPYIDNSDNLYYVNKRKCGLYELLSIFQESEPKNIDRAKGLGSLTDSEIQDSALDPHNRKLLRYTTKDIIKEVEEMRKINDDKYTLIKDLDISKYEF